MNYFNEKIAKLSVKRFRYGGENESLSQDAQFRRLLKGEVLYVEVVIYERNSLLRKRERSFCYHIDLNVK